MNHQETFIPRFRIFFFFSSSL